MIQRRRRYERDAATEELGVLQRQIGSFGLPKARATQAMTSIKTAINAMADHLSDTLTQIRTDLVSAAALKQDPEWPLQRRSYEEILRLIAPDREAPDGGEFDRDRDVDPDGSR